MAGKLGISSYDKTALSSTLKSEIRTTAGNLLNLGSSLNKLSNGDDSTRASLDPNIGTRTVQKRPNRKIGGSASSSSGGLGPMSTPARSANLLGNPYMRRYEGPNKDGNYTYSLAGSPMIGEYYDVFESENNKVRFLDDTIGKDLFGYTHLSNAAEERSGASDTDDNLYVRSTYSIFGDTMFPMDSQDVERNLLGPVRYSPVNPYVLEPLDTEIVRRAPDGSVQGFKDKFEAFLPGREPYMGPLLNMWDYMGSHVYLNLLNGVMEHGLYNENYQYEQRNRTAIFDMDAVPQSDYPYFIDVVTNELSINEAGNITNRNISEKEIKGLLGKTNRMFYEGKIKSLVNRFATLNGNDEGRPDFLNTATDHTYGLSRGRNLRKPNVTYDNGYPNPYCRVWTTHYQYSKYKNLIRGKWAEEGDNAGDQHLTLHAGDKLMRPNKGYARLKAMTSLDTENGRPIFAPYYVNNRDTIEEDSIKRCMFSIENLAWKDIVPDSTLIRKDKEETQLGARTVYEGAGASTIKTTTSETVGHAAGLGMTLTKEQRGPNGGRIMWFPPYNLKFNEQSRANWTDNAFIGRGEKIYSYVNSERVGTLSFTILVDHPSIINEWARGGKKGTTLNKAFPLSQDEMILRYFAGCDSLSFTPRDEYDVPYTTKKVDIEVSTEVPITGQTGTIKGNPTLKQDEQKNTNPDITFYSVFYYPNNYSGADLIGKKSDEISPGIEEMFSKGKRDDSSVGYELKDGNSTGMFYENGYSDGAYYRGKCKDGVTRSWFYPVDSRVHDEVLTGSTTRYKDVKDFGLNNDFWGDFWGNVPAQDGIIEYLNNGNSGLGGSEKNIEIAKSNLGLKTVEDKYFVPAYNFYKNLKQIKTTLDAASKNSYTYEIEVQGYASSHGYGDSNKILAENRAALIANWIENLGIFNFGTTDSIRHNGNGQIENTNKIGESDFSPKSARAAVVKFHIKPNSVIITDKTEYEEIPITAVTEIKTEVEKMSSVEEVYETGASEAFENQTYDDEYTYFKQINENDDMVKRYISDKVDYFDPAFHSITPEGFNARLTFLQQCVRQGPTISASDIRNGGNYGAGNLSFGRAPFCVLRIGDFFNTKILINNIDITYDNGGDVQWDLNPEGVGLQPMMANVNISFIFLGGSDLSGPIARLQNAVSYNYYANTSVYDRRADYRSGFVTPDDDTAKSWSPLILDKNKEANVTEHHDFYTRTGENKIVDLT